MCGIGLGDDAVQKMAHLLLIAGGQAAQVDLTLLDPDLTPVAAGSEQSDRLLEALLPAAGSVPDESNRELAVRDLGRAPVQVDI